MLNTELRFAIKKPGRAPRLHEVKSTGWSHWLPARFSRRFRCRRTSRRFPGQLFRAHPNRATEFSPIDRAKVLRMVPSAALAGLVAAHDFAVLGDGVLAFQHLHDGRGGGHEFGQFAKERTFLVNGIEAFGFAQAHPDALGGDDAQAGIFEHLGDGAGQIAAGCVGLIMEKCVQSPFCNPVRLYPVGGTRVSVCFWIS